MKRSYSAIGMASLNTVILYKKKQKVKTKLVNTDYIDSTQMKTLTAFIIGIFVFTLSWQLQFFGEFSIAEETTETNIIHIASQDLYSISEIKTSLELADVGFYPELINEPLKALDYTGNRKVAANLGVYLADFMYTVSTTEGEEIFMSYGAIMELSNNLDMSDDMMQIMLERYENENFSTEEILDMLRMAINNSDSNLSETKQIQLYTYLILGNYIEKLHLTSGIVMRPKQAELPVEAEANLKRGMLKYASEQSTVLHELLHLLTAFDGDETDKLVQLEIEKLISSYQKMEANRVEIMSLPLHEIYQTEEVVEVYTQIENIREKIVA